MCLGVYHTIQTALNIWFGAVVIICRCFAVCSWLLVVNSAAGVSLTYLFFYRQYHLLCVRKGGWTLFAAFSSTVSQWPLIVMAVISWRGTHGALRTRRSSSKKSRMCPEEVENHAAVCR